MSVIVEGVRYFRFRVRVRMHDGSRKQATVLSPGLPWLDSEVRRVLSERLGTRNIRSATVVAL